MNTVSNMLNSIHASSSVGQKAGVGGVANTTDLLQCSTMYARSISGTPFCNYSIFENLLRSCILWDTTSCPKISPLSEKSDISENNVLIDNVNRRLHVEVRGAVPSTLSIRFAQLWWVANRDGVLCHLDIAQVINSYSCVWLTSI
jgi:hypothetical protein